MLTFNFCQFSLSPVDFNVVGSVLERQIYSDTFDVSRHEMKYHRPSVI